MEKLGEVVRGLGEGAKGSYEYCACADQNGPGKRVPCEGFTQDESSTDGVEDKARLEID
jgi:hypothetical protein